jgi:hypothetical protein
MFWRTPLEVQLLTLLVMGHPWLFGIVRAATRKRRAESRDRDNASQPQGELRGPATATVCQGSAETVFGRLPRAAAAIE